MIATVLGSASPARLRVLRDAGLDPSVLVSDVDEEAMIAELGDAAPETVVTTLAQAKAEAVVAAILGSSDPTFASAAVDGVVLTCDSMLLLDGELSGKPHSPDIAVAQWRRMRGNVGHLMTGHCVTRLRDGAVDAVVADHQSTTVRFSDISDELIERYVATGEPLKVAGAFTLDGLGGWLLDGIDGDPSSVIGISLPLTRRLLTRVGVNVADLWR
ncbi:septum formation inhibitor Maf [Gordonia sp. PDNC005]|uniref:Maf family protein n=1 Tax=unclassified Gordonia (in: high G+C Gram-positive bacteria) TaxID=2657482 RepID=UPI001965980F|nr:nucleoside triphosphate pyrophosphatase [Gordonia sp. PDNC005]QRY63528.1 septum formation inhibitor Maf [Gordonia sp. PDNC005]